MQRVGTSALGELLGKRAGFREVSFIKSGGTRIAAVPRCRESRLDQLNRQFRHLGIAAADREKIRSFTKNPLAHTLLGCAVNNGLINKCQF